MECNTNIPFCNNTYSSGSCLKREEKKGVKKSKGSSVKLSTDPQSVAARERRHRIGDRFKILQSMIPGGSKLDTVSMLEEAIHYVKFLKKQIWLHETLINFVDNIGESHMFLPEHYSSNDKNIPSGSFESMQNLPQLPLEQFCFQGDEDIKTIFDATMKY